MKIEKVIIDGKEEEIVTEIDQDYMDDTVIFDDTLEDTLELSLDQIQDAWEKTIVIDGDRDYYE